MIQICLTKFTNGPWEEMTIKAFNKALSYYKNKFEIDIIKGYPQKKYDIIINSAAIIKTKNNKFPTLMKMCLENIKIQNNLIFFKQKL